MKIPIEAWIIAAAIIGTLIGWIGCAVLAAARMRRIERRTWNAARLYYTRSAASRLIH